VSKVPAFAEPLGLIAAPQRRHGLSDRNEHATSVEAWVQVAAAGLTAPQLAQLFEDVLGTLWHRAHRTLGDVTLVAIVERVIHSTAASSPLLAALRVDPSGFHCDELRQRASVPAELAQAMQVFIVEFLTVIGSLTAEILTPALHAELAGVKPASDKPRSRGNRGDKSPTGVISNEGKPQ
jgi:hypothetical protein